jgi:hypothetical protein
MRTFFGKSLLCVGLALLSACKERQPVPPPTAAASPEEGARHEYVLGVSDRFGAVQGVKAYAIYTIANERSCVPKDYSSAIGGRWNHFSERHELVVAPIGDTGFAASARDNPLRDENYYGLGVCHWTLSSLDFEVRFDRYSRVAFVTGAQALEGREIQLLCLSDPRISNVACVEKSRVPDVERSRYELMSIKIHME